MRHIWTDSIVAALAVLGMAMSTAIAADGVSPEKTTPNIRSLGNVAIPPASAPIGGDPFSLLHASPVAESHIWIPQLLARVNKVPPQYIYELARRLWATDKPSAMEWLAVGMARARFDSLRCVDKSAGQGIAFLSLIAPDVMTGIKENRKAFSAAGKRALSRSDLYAEAVSPMWICSHGIKNIAASLEGKITSESDWLKPPTEWASLKREVSADLGRYFDAQAKLPDEPAPSNMETLPRNIGEVAGVLSPGLDEKFGQHGLFKMSIEGKTIAAKDAVVQPDGKVIVAMELSDKAYATTTGVVRLNDNGTLDEQFGAGGIASLKIGANSRPERIALLPSGKIVVAGWAHVNSEQMGITVTRYNANGTIDEGFSTHGTLMLPNEHWSDIRALAVQADGKIVVGGSMAIREERIEGLFVKSVSRVHFFLARIGSNGSLDSDFGQKGLVATNVGGNGYVTALIPQPDGKIVAAGFETANDKLQMVVARYSSTGALDKTFGSDGLDILETDIPRYGAPNISVLSDGRILMSFLSSKELWMSKFLPDGKIDQSFGADGRLKVAVGLLERRAGPLLTTDNKIMVSGSMVRPPESDKSQPPYYYRIGVLRLLPDGGRDSVFGPDGMQVFSVGSVDDRVASMVNQGSGRIILVGSSKEQVDSQLILMGLVH